MNHTFTSGLLVASLILIPVAAQAADAGKATTEYVKDSVITTKIKAELAAEKMSSLVKINVDTDKNGMVVLTGTTSTMAGSDRAVAIAKGVKGVSSVKNDIKVVADK